MPCPDSTLLQQLLDDTLPAEQKDALQSHLSACPTCQAAVERLVASGPTWDKTARNLAAAPTSDETALVAAMEQLRDSPTRTPQLDAGAVTQAPTSLAGAEFDEDLTFLQPSSKPGSIGRLDKYEIESVVGRGGFGIVLKAFDESLHRVVAIKIMAPQIAANGAARKRFIKEARAAAAVTHEHVVAIYDVNENARIPYLAMQFVSGMTLHEKLEKHGSLSVKEILRIGMQIAAGLSAAHKQGLIHRDIKPGNVLLENGVERVKITDFGLARSMNDASETQSGTVAGTPMYMSPEQAAGEIVDHRSDLFSLGSVLYVMCTGTPPFRAHSTLAVMKRVAEDTPSPIRANHPEIPDWLCAIVEKLHAKKPDARYQTAKEVADLLGERLADVQAGRAIIGEDEQQTIRIEKPTIAPAPVAQPRKSPKFALGIVAIMALAVVLALVFWPRGDGNNDPNRKSTPTRGEVKPLAVIPRALAVIFGWTQLFDGQDLTGWKKHPDQTKPWVIRERELASTDPATYLFTEKNSWQHFHLRTEILLTPGGFVGFYYRTDFDIRNRGKSTNVAADAYHFWQGGATSIRRTAESIELHDGLGRWQTLEIIVHDNWTEVIIDGRNVYTARDDKAVVKAGHLALKATENIRFKKIEIKEIAPEPTPVVEPGWVQLFDGKDLIGFENSKDERWWVADGLATSTAATRSAERAVLKQHSYENFHLKFEARFSEGAIHDIAFRSADDGSAYLLKLIPGAKHMNITSNSKELKSFQNVTVGFASAPSDRWFQGEIIADGRKTLVKIDGIMLQDYELPTVRPGAIRFTTHGGRVDYKRIEIKELRTSPLPLAVAPFTAAEAEKHQAAWAKHLAVDSEVTNSIGMKLMLIPPGEFQMAKEYRVRISKPYFLGAHEVTVGQFRAFVKETGHKTEAETNGLGGLTNGGQQKPTNTWQSADFAPGDDFPVRYLSWNDAVKFCEWLSAKEKRKYRLPTEAEWEWACRSGSTGKYHFGDDPKELDAHAWYVANSKNTAHPVGKKKANAWGLFDTLGNVAEFCRDRHAPFPTGKFTDPTGPAIGEIHAIRSYAFSDTPEWTTCSARATAAPKLAHANFGFRVLLQEVVATPKVAPRPQANYALFFDGKSAYVDVPSLRYETDQPVTIEARVKFDQAMDVTETIACGYSPKTALCLARTNGKSISFLARQGLKANFAGLDDKHADSKWLHVAGVWDGKTARLYIDGTLQPKTSSNKVLPANAANQQQNFMIGAEIFVPSTPMHGHFHGVMDEIRISKVARYTEDFKPEIRFIPDKDTVALYHCDEADGEKLIDESGNNHHGKAVGVKWVKADWLPPAPSIADLLTSPDYEWSTPENLGPAVNAGKRNLSPSFTSDERTLIFSSDKKLWVSRRASLQEPFGKPTLLPEVINSDVGEAASISGDGLMLAISSSRPGSQFEDLWLSTRKSVDDEFGAPVRLPEPVNSMLFERVPVLSADGLTLFVTSTKKGGPGSGDISMFSRKTRTEPFANEVILPEPVNTPAYDTANWISPDGRVLVTTKMSTPPFETRFHIRPTSEAPFGPPQSFGPPLDTLSIGRPWISDDGQRMYFHARGLPGSHGDIDLWMTRRVPKRKQTATPIDAPEHRITAPDLTKVKPYYSAIFKKVVPNWLIQKQNFYDQGFANGRYYIAIDPGTSRSCFCPAEPVGDFVCEVVGRITGSPASNWALEIQNVARDRYLYFKLNGKQEMEIMAVGKGADTFKSVGPIRHPAIKAGEEFNTLRIAMRGKTIDIFVNGVAIRESLTTDFVITPATFGVLAFADENKASRAEFERLSLWSPIPAVEARSTPALNNRDSFTNAIGMEFRRVPKGKAKLGGSGGGVGPVEREFNDFYLGTYEVTQFEWEFLMGKDRNPSLFRRLGEGREAVDSISDAELNRFPVDSVSWIECQEFIRRLNEKTKETGWIYRLPTSDEWEYACRGGPANKEADHTFDYYLGMPTNTLTKDQANTKETGLDRTRRVGSYPPNSLGLYDMHGNVFEYTDDAVMRDGETLRHLRGGCWRDPIEFARAGHRGLGSGSASYNGGGLRVARVPVK